MVYPDVTTVNQAKSTGLLGLAGWLFSSEFNSDDSRLNYLGNRYPNLVSNRLNQAFAIAKSAYTAAQILANTGSVTATQVPRGAIGLPPGMKYAYDVTAIVDYDDTTGPGQAKHIHLAKKYVVYSASLLNSADLQNATADLFVDDLAGDTHYGVTLDDIPPSGLLFYFSAISRA